MSNHARKRANKAWRPKQDIASEQVRKDVVMLLTARIFLEGTGSDELINLSMVELMEDPERMGGAVLSMLSMLSQFAQGTTKAEGLVALTNYLLSTLNLPLIDGGI
jgi:hypothetical protein